MRASSEPQHLSGLQQPYKLPVGAVFVVGGGFYCHFEQSKEIFRHRQSASQQMMGGQLWPEEGDQPAEACGSVGTKELTAHLL